MRRFVVYVMVFGFPIPIPLRVVASGDIGITLSGSQRVTSTHVFRADMSVGIVKPVHGVAQWHSPRTSHSLSHSFNVVTSTVGLKAFVSPGFALELDSDLGSKSSVSPGVSLGPISTTTKPFAISLSFPVSLNAQLTGCSGSCPKDVRNPLRVSAWVAVDAVAAVSVLALTIPLWKSEVP